MNEASHFLAVGLIAELARQRAGWELWRDDSGALSWEDFGAAVEAARLQCVDAGVARGSVIITPGEAEAESLIWLFGAAATGAVIAPLRQERENEFQAWREFIEIGWRVQAGRIVRVGDGVVSPLAARLLGELDSRGHPGLVLATGGTSGTPKLVLHDLAALLAAVPVKTGRARRTLPLMRFDHIGGLDVAWRALGSGQALVAPPVNLTAEAVARTVARHRVEVLPATPSLLNLLLAAEVHRTHDLSSLQIVAYGAEPMPAGLLKRLRLALPHVDLVQRFGTTETGALPVRDVGAGLVLREDEDGFAWKVVDQELWVRSPTRALGYLSGGGEVDSDGWFHTGDIAKRMPDGSMCVLGRIGERINVGGEKIMPSEVESVLLSHPLVTDCRVTAEPNALLGQVVVAEIVWRGPESDPVAVKRLLHAFAGGSLPKRNLPVRVLLVRAIDTTRNLKKLRVLSQ